MAKPRKGTSIPDELFQDLTDPQASYVSGTFWLVRIRKGDAVAAVDVASRRCSDCQVPCMHLATAARADARLRSEFPEGIPDSEELMLIGLQRAFVRLIELVREEEEAGA